MSEGIVVATEAVVLEEGLARGNEKCDELSCVVPSADPRTANRTTNDSHPHNNLPREVCSDDMREKCDQRKQQAPRPRASHTRTFT